MESEIDLKNKELMSRQEKLNYQQGRLASEKLEFNNQKNTLVFLESGDEVLNYVEAAKYFLGSNIDITYGGSHSYESITNKLEKIVRFIGI